ncbi:origin recognition complex subunit 1 [Pieris brassicae]|uniref:Origin recognition complex subunit 1 n=1 Tax=Pieris brassicae TaxID=7116 RepID=A0A9P0TI56_PIEBR|nr:origin recognition complex subunit 1 [Pieris brassicae]CAH4030346.1 unnamed protein product [Pieris brassicae]
MHKRRDTTKSVTWLSEEISNQYNFSTTFHYYKKFQFKDIIAEVGDYVCVSNADSAEPDTEEGCDAAKILALYEDKYNKHDPFRAKVQWYSKPSDLPKGCLNSQEYMDFSEREVVEDHRPFDTDVSIETFFKKCHINTTFTSDNQISSRKPYHYICKYRLITITKRKVTLEPVLEEERQALQLLVTPKKTTTPKTPNSLIKKMSRATISERNWSISKHDGTKLLLKRAILSDKNDKEPYKTSESNSPGIEKPINVEEIQLLKLKENSNGELPTLIIRKHIPTTPKRKIPSQKSPPRNTIHMTPKKNLFIEEEKCYATRSGRKTKNPVSYCEPEVSPVKKTPSHKVLDTSDEFSMITRTPRSSRTPRVSKTPRASLAKTPKTVRRIVTSELTPTLHSRAHSVENIDDFTKDNSSLPGREVQLDEILSFVRSKLLNNLSGCMYISGVPGTGKTATVNTALKLLKEEVDLPEFQLVEVNGMRIAEPRQAYVQIYKQLTGKSVVWEQACALLEKRFTNSGPRRVPTVLLVDELDALCNRRQDVLYSIMEWAAHNTARLTVLAVANTMDLPERALAARVASRLGLTRLPFPPYTHMQLQCIVATKLAGANVTPDAVQLIARKVAAVSGDARRAIALCTRALELAEGQAGLLEVQKALDEAASSATVRAIGFCSPAEKLMLRAVAAEVERTGSDETTLSKALATAAAIVALDGRPYRCATSVRAPTPTQAQAICARLAALKLLLLEPKPSEPRLLLNISTSDVYYATRYNIRIDG